MSTTSSYEYSGYLWPAFISAVFVASLSAYAWRHRRVAGALAFAVGCLFGVAWSLGSLLEHAAIDPETKIWWMRFVTVWQLPVVAVATCFILQYGGWGSRLSRRLLILFAVPPLLSAIFISSDGLHHLFWSRLRVLGSSIEATLGPVGQAALDYSYILAAVNFGLLVWLFIRFPLRRAVIVMLLLGQIGARLLFELGVLRLVFPAQWDPDPLVLAIVFGLYAVALFRFHLFDPVPAARAAALDQMVEGMLVVDLDGRIVEANPAAARIFRATANQLRGRATAEVLHGAAAGPHRSPGADALLGAIDTEAELDMPGEGGTRHYRVEPTPLRDKGGHDLGRLLLLHDVTDQKSAQTSLLEQECVVATLEERQRLARELHDSVGQTLGYVSLQTQTIRKWLQDGDASKADSLLARLAHVAQNAHADVRESILALRAASSNDWSFLPTLTRYLDDFGAYHGIQTELLVSEAVTEDAFEPRIGVQLLRVVQEALMNARRHGGATTVRVSLRRNGDRLSLVMEDDGAGFDPVLAPEADAGHFGLAFMRERMAQIGGTMSIDSQPGVGTSVNLEAPTTTRQEGRA